MARVHQWVVAFSVKIEQIRFVRTSVRYLFKSVRESCRILTTGILLTKRAGKCAWILWDSFWSSPTPIDVIRQHGLRKNSLYSEFDAVRSNTEEKINPTGLRELSRTTRFFKICPCLLKRAHEIRGHPLGFLRFSWKLRGRDRFFLRARDFFPNPYRRYTSTRIEEELFRFWVWYDDQIQKKRSILGGLKEGWADTKVSF